MNPIFTGMILLGAFDFLHQLFNSSSELPDPAKFIRYGGLLVLFLVTFAQTGVFFCFFLPGGAIMFMAGVMAASDELQQNIVVVFIVLLLAAFLGNITGYWIGRKTGPLLFKRKDSLLFKQKHLEVARNFYYEYGRAALMFGMFPIVIRTFSPIVAGIVKLDFTKLVVFSFIGATLWVGVFLWSGYFLGRLPFVEKNLGWFISLILVSILIPIAARGINKLRNQNHVIK